MTRYTIGLILCCAIPLQALAQEAPLSAELTALLRETLDPSQNPKVPFAERIEALGPKAAPLIPVLVRAMYARDPAVRRRACRAMGDFEIEVNLLDYHKQLPYRKAYTGARAKLLDLARARRIEGSTHHRRAFGALQFIDSPAEVLATIRLGLQTQNEDVLEYVVEVAGELVIDEAGALVDDLCKLLDKPEPEARYEVAAALGDLARKPALSVAALVRLTAPSERETTRRRAAASLVAFGPHAVPAIDHLVKMLDVTDEPDLPIAAAEALGAIGEKAAHAGKRIIEAYRGLPARVGTSDRVTMIRAVSRVGADPAMTVPFLLSLTADQAVGTEALMALGDCVLPKAVIEKIAEALAAKDKETRLAAARAILQQPAGAPHRAQALKVLRAAMVDNRWEAVDFWPRRGATELFPLLRKFLAEEYGEVTAPALALIGPAAREALPALEALLPKLEDPDDRLDVAVAILAIGGPDSSKPAREELARWRRVRPVDFEHMMRRCGMHGLEVSLP